MSQRPLNATAASLLGFLHEGPLTGWDLVGTAQTVIGNFWSLTQSQVYRELTAMADAGLVVAGERGPRDRRPYSITYAGRVAFAAWLDREPGPELIRFPLLLTLAFGKHLPPGRIAAFLAAHRAVHARRLAGYEEQQAAAAAATGELDTYALATLEFGLSYERAVLDWFDRLPDPVTDGGAATTLPGTTSARD
ncbi:MAG: helix-turn-helix transcriptional regulator [Pseudonocardiales bacterium]